MISFQNLFQEEFLQKANQLHNHRKDRINNSKEFILWAEPKIKEAGLEYRAAYSLTDLDL